MKNILSYRDMVLVALAVAPGFAAADVTSTSPTLPPPNSFFDVFTDIQFSPPGVPPYSLSHYTLSQFDSGASLDPTQLLPAVQHSTGLCDFDMADGSHVSSFFDIYYDLVDVSTDPTGLSTFDTEMMSMDITGGSMPNGMRLRESPTKQSLGKTSIRESPTKGTYQISSFFDIFTELSIDGGQSWTPSSSSNELDLRSSPVPEPASMATLAIGAVALLRRRNSKHKK